jgi:hypothetical protein
MDTMFNMNRLLGAMTIFSLVLIAMVLVSVRRQHIRVEYSVSWLSAALVLLVLSRSPTLFYAVADFIGVGYAPVGMLLVIFCVFLVVFYRFSIRISALKDANIALAQRVAILEYQLRSFDEERQSTT